MKHKEGSASTAQLIGIREIGEQGLVTERGGETCFFLVKPSNLSVLSKEGLEERIQALTTVLRGVAEIGLMCLDSRENFDENKAFLRKRLEEESEPAVRRLLLEDLRHLDGMQVRMATAREFLILAWPREKGERERGAFLSRIHKMLDEQGFKGRIAGREDIKRLLAVYFEQNVTNEVLDDYDGERWVIGSGQERWTWGA